jgi:YbgC/YbaW family acyl-CoA thioester hydrolase
MIDALFRFSTNLEVRWRDVDALRHVNNAVFFTYLEQARVHYLRELGFALDNPTDVGIIIAESSCRFKSPLRLREQVTKALFRNNVAYFKRLCSQNAYQTAKLFLNDY